MKLTIPDQPEDPVDLTPMIDVTFLLIVFFMTVANLITEQKIQLELPVAEESMIPRDLGVRQMVSVTSDGSLYAGVSEVDPEQLTAIVRQGSQEFGSEFKVFVRGDKDTPFMEIRKVMDACAAAGVTDITFAAYQSDK